VRRLCVAAGRALIRRFVVPADCFEEFRVLVFTRATLTGNVVGASAGATRNHPRSRTYASSFFSTPSGEVIYVNWYATVECKATQVRAKIAACEKLADCVPLRTLGFYQNTGALGFQCQPPALAAHLTAISCSDLQPLILIMAAEGADLLTLLPFAKATQKRTV
jgi:hypothetical protein